MLLIIVWEGVMVGLLGINMASVVLSCVFKYSTINAIIQDIFIQNFYIYLFMCISLCLCVCVYVHVDAVPVGAKRGH